MRQAILFPVLLAFLVAPYLLDWLTTVYADIPMGYLVALAALLVILWIEEREPWQLAAATVLLSGAMLTKREGMLFVACVLLAGFVASFAERRQLWRRLLAAGLVAFALVLPWRIWFTAHDLPAVGPDTGYTAPSRDLDRVWPALEISRPERCSTRASGTSRRSWRAAVISWRCSPGPGGSRCSPGRSSSRESQA